MIKPAFLDREDQPTIVGRVFGTPIVVKGWSGLPLIGIAMWVGLYQLMKRKQPNWSWYKRAWTGALNATIMLGSEWCHNLAHTAVASRIGKPVDAIRIFWGTPLLIYYDINDQQVTPRQHIYRALGGPVFSTLTLPLIWLIKKLTREGTLARNSADFALGVNAFITSLSLIPIPFLDGGPLLKWSLVEKGYTRAQADEKVKEANLIAGSGLVVASGVALKKRRRWLGTITSVFAAGSFIIGLGLLKEQK